MQFFTHFFMLASFITQQTNAFQTSNPLRCNRLLKEPSLVMKAASKDFKDKLPGKFYVNVGMKQSYYVDPLGISKSASEDSIRLWREAELTHGRVSMLSFLHYLSTDVLNFHPFFPENNGVLITHLSNTPDSVVGMMGVIISSLEFYRAEKGWLVPTKPENLWTLRDSYEPGNLGFDPLNFKKTNPQLQRKFQEQELNNGRLANIALAGIVAQQLVAQNGVL